MQMTAPLAMASEEEKFHLVQKVIAEMNKNQKNRIAASERASQIEKSRNALLARDLEARKAREAVRPCLADRIWEKLVNAYAVTFAVIYIIAGKLVVIDEEK